MAQEIIILVWIVVTFLVVSVSAVLAKRHGVEYLIGALVSLIVIANILANKIVVFGPFTVPAGIIAFSMSFLITDIISERWGKAYAKKAVWIGFYGNVLLIISVWIAVKWQSAPFALEASEMFSEVLGLTPRIALASMVTYLASQHHDVWAFHFWKKLTKGKHLWLRNNASTITSQLIDSSLFIFLGFYGVFPIIPLIIGQWVVKIIIALIDTPFMYGVLLVMDKVRAKGMIPRG